MLFFGEVFSVVFETPGDGGRVEIEADGGVGLVAADPLAGGVACATEVLADVEEFAGADFLEGGFDEVEFGLRALDGTLVKEVPIGVIAGENALAFLARGVGLVGLGTRSSGFGLWHGAKYGTLGRGSHGAGRIWIGIGPIRGEQFSRADPIVGAPVRGWIENLSGVGTCV